MYIEIRVQWNLIFDLVNYWTLLTKLIYSDITFLFVCIMVNFQFNKYSNRVSQLHFLQFQMGYDKEEFYLLNY